MVSNRGYETSRARARRFAFLYPLHGRETSSVSAPLCPEFLPIILFLRLLRCGLKLPPATTRVERSYDILLSARARGRQLRARWLHTMRKTPTWHTYEVGLGWLGNGAAAVSHPQGLAPAAHQTNYSKGVYLNTPPTHLCPPMLLWLPPLTMKTNNPLR